jgi:hypothetical protein
LTDRLSTHVLAGARRSDWLAMSGQAGGPVRLGKVSDVTPKLAHVGYLKFYITSGEAFQGHSPAAAARLSIPEEHGQVRQDAETRMVSSDIGKQASGMPRRVVRTPGKQRVDASHLRRASNGAGDGSGRPWACRSQVKPSTFHFERVYCDLPFGKPIRQITLRSPGP